MRDNRQLSYRLRLSKLELITKALVLVTQLLILVTKIAIYFLGA